MTPHHELVHGIAARQLVGLFTTVDGLPEAGTDNKTEHLRSHLTDTGLDPAITAVIGDSDDDAAAAREAGIQTVQIASGTTSRARLDVTGHPVVDSITDALLLPMPLSLS